MSMTGAVKAELAALPVTRPCCRKAETSASLRFAGGLHIVHGRIVVEAELDTGAVARRLRKDLAEVYNTASCPSSAPAGCARPATTWSASPGTVRRWPARPACWTAAAAPSVGSRPRSSGGRCAVRRRPGGVPSWPGGP